MPLQPSKKPPLTRPLLAAALLQNQYCCVHGRHTVQNPTHTSSANLASVLISMDLITDECLFLRMSQQTLKVNVANATRTRNIQACHTWQIEFPFQTCHSGTLLILPSVTVTQRKQITLLPFRKSTQNVYRSSEQPCMSIKVPIGHSDVDTVI